MKKLIRNNYLFRYMHSWPPIEDKLSARDNLKVFEILSSIDVFFLPSDRDAINSLEIILEAYEKNT